MKKALSVIPVVFLSLSLLAACNGGESETQKELAALKEQLAQQQKQQAERENQEQEHRKQIEQRQREDELYQKAYQDAQEDLQMKQMLEEEKKQEEAKKKQAAEEERKREEAKKKQVLEEERKQKEETRIKQEEPRIRQEEPRIRQEETPKATAKPTVSQQAPKVTEKLVRYPAFVISESGSGSLNLRGGPSISAVSVTQLKDGQQLQVVAETNACTNANGGCWVKVQVGGLTGYVSNAYLQKGHVRDIGYPE